MFLDLELIPIAVLLIFTIGYACCAITHR